MATQIIKVIICMNLCWHVCVRARVHAYEYVHRSKTWNHIENVYLLPFQAKDSVISLPEKCLLTTETVLKSYMGDYMKRYLDWLLHYYIIF